MLTREMQAKKAKYIKERARKEVGACYEDIMRHNDDVLIEVATTQNIGLIFSYIELDERIKRMENPWFAVSAFIYEMQNHKYLLMAMRNDREVLQEFSRKLLQSRPIGDGSYEVYLKEMGKEEWIKPYKVARKIISGTY